MNIKKVVAYNYATEKIFGVPVGKAMARIGKPYTPSPCWLLA